ncbi:hypothetical protein [Streptomyces mirabilis]|uniref:Phage integrase family protein n=1 Tax=Streptomyces mirabilis TaxID=68239 RepID=A0ABU3UAP5_9ACTN|nr:hypothetical protein [Streptomyces mirabilis]MDU8990976.1 hypothetical protein [Streptomyces mirabilis]
MTAKLTLTSDDLRAYGTPRAKAAGWHANYYPIEMIRALVGVWLFGGLRMDEIRRLELEGVRWDQATDPDNGETYRVCLLHIPANKTTAAFSKPVDPIVGELIDAWKDVRPAQPDITDRKTGQRRQHLFCYRAQLIGSAYLNDKLIAILCAKAGIPESDSRGALTSHRARATIATELLNAKYPCLWLTCSNGSDTSTHPAPATTPRSSSGRCQRLTRRPTTSPGTCAPSRSSSTVNPSSRALPPAASSRGSTTTWVRATALTTSSPNAPTGWPAPAARSTSPRPQAAASS